MYHSHYAVQKESGLHGLIKVSLPSGKSEPFKYNYDHNIVLSDLYHSSSYEEALKLTSIPFVWVGEPQVFHSLQTSVSGISFTNQLF